MMQTLSEIAAIHKTDKCTATHTYDGLSYTDIYEEHFRSLRMEKLNILEIGVLKGASIRMWRDYFPNAKIFGIDVNPDCKRIQGDRIEIIIGSQEDEKILASVVDKAGGFDIVVDDGSHVIRMILASFEYLWKYIKSKGWYVIEDLGCTMEDASIRWWGMKYNENLDFHNDREDFDRWLVKKLRTMDQHQGDIRAIHYYPYMVFLQKTLC